MDSGEPRFICDDHCGRLARWLRFLGFDCLHNQNATDAQVLSLAATEDRVILTRDAHLAAKVLARQVHLLHESDPVRQLQEVIRAQMMSPDRKRLLTRCTICNHPTNPVDPSGVWERIPPYVRKTKTAFKLCMSCGRVYWDGTHVERMLEGLKKYGVEFRDSV
jgi:uncharacterized protein with PIN domain